MSRLNSKFIIGIALFFLVMNDVIGRTEIGTAGGVRIKDLARVKGVRENALVGYGIVVGLAGTGDSSRTKSTYQSIANTLVKFGVKVDKNDIQSRNVASVMITSNLPAFAETGDTFDIHVSSLGDAKSLAGGTLLLAPLEAPNGKTYALAQGQLSVGGYKYDSFGNVVQKNHPTVGIVTKGATVEKETSTDYIIGGSLQLILNEPDFTTASRVASNLKKSIAGINVEAVNAGKVKIYPSLKDQSQSLTQLISQIENVMVVPDIKAKVVINERTGTVVSGGNVQISSVAISHGNLKLKIDARYSVSQPARLFRPSESIRTQVVPEIEMNASEEDSKAVFLTDGTSVMELIEALKAVNLNTRDTITILHSIKQAGALHAELIIQ